MWQKDAFTYKPLHIKAFERCNAYMYIKSTCSTRRTQRTLKAP